MATELNDTPSAPLRWEFNIHGKTVTVGQFYNSHDKKYHLAIYIPYQLPPQNYLCLRRGNFSPSRETRKSRNACLDCFGTKLTLESMYG